YNVPRSVLHSIPTRRSSDLDLNGQIAPETLKNIVDWQWPTNAIQLQNINFNYKTEQGFSQTDGQLQWAGGELIYTYAQRQDRMRSEEHTSELQSRFDIVCRL